MSTAADRTMPPAPNRLLDAIGCVTLAKQSTTLRVHGGGMPQLRVDFTALAHTQAAIRRAVDAVENSLTELDRCATDVGR